MNMICRLFLLCSAAIGLCMPLSPGMRDSLQGPFALKKVGRWHWQLPDDGTVHIDGDWKSPYCAKGKILQADAAWVQGGKALQLKVPGGTCNAGEWQSDAGWSPDNGAAWPDGRQGYGYGSYQVQMQTGYGPANGKAGSSVGGNGTVESFFLKGLSANHLTPLEIDIEFLTNGRWDTAASRTGEVWLTLDGTGGDSTGSKRITLPFNPSAGFHTYRIDFQPGRVTWYADGHALLTLALADATLAPDGMTIMANDWTGNSNWGGLRPAQTVTALYRSLAYRPGK